MQKVKIGPSDAKPEQSSQPKVTDVPSSREARTFEWLEGREAPAVDIVFDYSLDTNGFFNDMARRDLLDQVAKLFEARFADTLDAIVPSGANTWTPIITDPATGNQRQLSSNLQVPADTIIVFAGGRDLEGGPVGLGGGGGFQANGSQTWLNTVIGRGEPGAVGPVFTDFAPWGGSLTFDTVGTNWHFGATTSGLEADEIDFLTIAMHELGHVFGLGASKAWNQLIVNGAFVGANAVAEFGGNVPLDADLDHFADGTQSNGVPSAMTAALPTGARLLLSELDFAALDDIGWEVIDPNQIQTVYVSTTFTAAAGTKVDGDLMTAGMQEATIGTDAFSTIAEAFAVVADNGTLILNDGDYNETWTINRPLTIQAANSSLQTLNIQSDSQLNPLGDTATITLQIDNGMQLNATLTSSANLKLAFGQSNNDSTLQVTGKLTAPNRTVTISGGTGNDLLEIAAAGTNVRLDLAKSIWNLDDQAYELVDIENLFVNSPAESLTVEYTNAAETVTLEDDNIADNQISQLSATAQPIIQFRHPTNQLQIHLAGGAVMSFWFRASTANCGLPD